MYGIFTYIFHKNQPNVGSYYTIHGWYGKENHIQFLKGLKMGTANYDRDIVLQLWPCMLMGFENRELLIVRLVWPDCRKLATKLFMGHCHIHVGIRLQESANLGIGWVPFGWGRAHLLRGCLAHKLWVWHHL